MIGSTVSHYRVKDKLGEGGMGEVFRGEDTKLGRDVALKVLPEAFARDPERMARFEREARILASLNHPAIAGIYDLVEADGRSYLVMEVAEGSHLADRIARGPIPLETALDIATQIAEALECAHDAGIVHRDLKPANVHVTDDLRVKVLDFGLAKALDGSTTASAPDLQNSPTLTQHHTTAGVLLGTAGYMSPEQARGLQADRRSDVWAFGCVLYEMLTGASPYQGNTLTDVLASIVREDPEWDRLPADTPPRLRALIRRCLRKDPRQRLQSIGDARIALEEIRAGGPPEEIGETPAGASRPGYLPWAIAALGAVLALAAGAWALSRDSGGPARAEPLRRLDVRMGDTAFDYSLGSAVAFSPHGRYLAYVTGTAGSTATLHLRALDRSEPIELATGTGANTSPYHPFFSPDGEWVGFVTASEMKKVSVTGGPPMVLTPVQRSRGASWSGRGIVFAPSPTSGLFLVPGSGGQEATVVTEPDPSKNEVSHRWPQWLPDGRSVLFTVTNSGTNAEESWLEVLDLDSGERKVVHPSGYYGRYVASGHVLFASDGTLFALPFDLDSLEATGPAVPVLNDVAGGSAEGTAHYDVSADGMLAYLTGEGSEPRSRIVQVDRRGHADPLWSELGWYANPRLSPDGDRLAVSAMRDNNWDVWVFDLQRAVATRLTFDSGYDADQTWSPDGEWLYFASDRDGPVSVYRKRSDGSGDVERVLETVDGPEAYPTSVSSDGRFLVVQTGMTGGDLWTVPLDGGEPRRFQASSFSERYGVVSPDDRLIAYASNESGRGEVYVRPFPEGGGKWQLSEGGGGAPRWSADGKTLFYRTDDGLSAVAVDTTGGRLRADRNVELFRGDFRGGTGGLVVAGFVFPDFDAVADGEHFVMLEGDTEETSSESWVRLVTGWFQELRALAPAR